MSLDISNNINSAIVSGHLGLSRASDGITQSASKLASLSLSSAQDPQTSLNNVATTQLSAIKQMLPSGDGSISSELVNLSINSHNALASAKVIDTANETVGTILDILA